MPRLTNIQTERIATTVEGRAVTLVKITRSKEFGSDPSKIRVMLFAQQHGDEPAGKEALLKLLGKAFSGSLDEILSGVDILLVPQMNPDGSERRQRRTATGIDMNRSHVLLDTPEVKALHDLFLAWMPHVTVDMHEYASFNPVWLHSGVIRTADVQLGVLTNLNSSSVVRAYQRGRVLPFVAASMHQQGYKFHEYLVGDPHTGVRHSTTEINDGRQSFGLYNTLSFLIEGRKWRSFDDQMERRASSQLAAVEALLKFCVLHASEIRMLVGSERDSLATVAGRRVILRMDHVSEGRTAVIPGRTVATDADTDVAIAPYHEKVRPIASVAMPSGYIIPAEYQSVARLLRTHGIATESIDSTRRIEVWRYTVESMRPSVVEGERLPDPLLRLEPTVATLHRGDTLVRSNQIHSLMLATLLEPASIWNLARYRAYEGMLQEGRYPIMRVMEQ